METSNRQAQIEKNLGIRPISHGQVHTFQIAVPDSQRQDISQERRQTLAESLTQHNSNLVPLIVRRTEAYSEEEEYEVIYGADWCLVAKELDIEKLWVWVFDMNDQAAAAAKLEMEQLLGSTLDPLPPSSSPDGISEVKSLLQKFEFTFQQKIDHLTSQVEELKQGNFVRGFEEVLKPYQETMVSKLQEALQSLLESKQPTVKPIPQVEPNTAPSKYDEKKLTELKTLAKKKKIKNYSTMKKSQLITALKQADAS